PARHKASRTEDREFKARALYSKPRARFMFFRKRRQYLLAPEACPGGFACPAGPPGSSLDERSLLGRGGSATAPVVIGAGLLGLSTSALGTQSPAGLNAFPSGHLMATKPFGAPPDAAQAAPASP